MSRARLVITAVIVEGRRSAPRRPEVGVHGRPRAPLDIQQGDPRTPVQPLLECPEGHQTAARNSEQPESVHSPKVLLTSCWPSN
jgi:hypothetical protein